MRVIKEYWFALLIVILLAGCNEENNGSDGSAPKDPPIGDLNGTWRVEDSSVSSTAGCSEYSEQVFTFRQNGNALTVIDQDGNEYTGSISGNNISWSGSYPDGSGTTTIDRLSGTINSQCTQVTGSSSWRYRETGFSCNGTSTFTAYRLTGGTDCGNSGNNDNLSETEPNPISNPNQINAPATINGQVSGSEILFSNGTNNSNPITPNDLLGYQDGEDYDAFEFTPSSFGLFNFSLDTNNQDMDLYVFNSSAGVLVAVSASEGTVDERINNVIGDSSVTYMVVVVPWSISGSGNYVLTIVQQ